MGVHGLTPVGGVDGRPTAIGAAGRRALLTPRGLAEHLSLSERTVRELLRTGELPSYKVAGARRIDPDDVDAWLAGRRRERRAA
jgi:excisionase family DNA binding protein